MTFRSYKIRLEPRDNIYIPAGLPKLFNALISDPSNLVPLGNTKQRGLSFLDTEGILLTNPVLKHIPVMNKLPYPITEEDEISNVISQSLHEYYTLKSEDVTIHITRA